jgi:hypothetical protein
LVGKRGRPPHERAGVDGKKIQKWSEINESSAAECGIDYFGLEKGWLAGLVYHCN